MHDFPERVFLLRFLFWLSDSEDVQPTGNGVRPTQPGPVGMGSAAAGGAG
jgi:hypothetical protein